MALSLDLQRCYFARFYKSCASATCSRTHLQFKIIIKIYPFIICPISSCHGSRRVKRLFDFTTFLPACELACQYSLYSCGGTLPNRVHTERIIVTSHCHGGKISGSQQSALTETAGRNVWGTVLFLSAILHRKVIHVKYFRFFFLPYLQGYVCS